MAQVFDDINNIVRPTKGIKLFTIYQQGGHMAKLYYLENNVKTYNDQAKYFVNGSDLLWASALLVAM